MAVAVPRVLGIDDWAWRKGHRYGTILCDLEKRRVIDLLPDREAESVARWLREHPGTEIISATAAGSMRKPLARPLLKLCRLPTAGICWYGRANVDLLRLRSGGRNHRFHR